MSSNLEQRLFLAVMNHGMTVETPAGSRRKQERRSKHKVRQEAKVLPAGLRKYRSSSTLKSTSMRSDFTGSIDSTSYGPSSSTSIYEENYYQGDSSHTSYKGGDRDAGSEIGDEIHGENSHVTVGSDNDGAGNEVNKHESPGKGEIRTNQTGEKKEELFKGGESILGAMKGLFVLKNDVREERKARGEYEEPNMADDLKGFFVLKNDIRKKDKERYEALKAEESLTADIKSLFVLKNDIREQNKANSETAKAGGGNKNNNNTLNEDKKIGHSERQKTNAVINEAFVEDGERNATIMAEYKESRQDLTYDEKRAKEIETLKGKNKDQAHFGPRNSTPLKKESTEKTTFFQHRNDELKIELIQELKEAFRLFDKKNAGIVRASDLVNILRTIGMNPAESEILEIMADLDVDGDGKVELHDFVRVMLGKMSTADSAEEIANVFKVFDRDGNGYINAAELKYMMCKVIGNVTDDEVEELMAEVDVDGDGRINYSEFVQMMTGGLGYDEEDRQKH